MLRKIIVTDISPTVSEKTVKDFLSFCGRIIEFQLVKDDKSDKQIAYVTFEKAEAAKTALMLSDAIIEGDSITIKPDDSEDSTSNSSSSASCSGEGTEQEDKAKTEIFVELLVAGYQLTETIIQKGIDFDASMGISTRVKDYLIKLQANIKSFDEQYKVSETVAARAVEINERYAVQDKVKYAATQVQGTASRALDTNAGKRVAEFYLNTSVQAAGVYQVARRIANEKKSKAEVSSENAESVQQQ